MNDIGNYDSLNVDDYMALTALCTEYCWLRDFSHPEKIPDLYTEDCVWEPPAGVNYAPTILRGRKALAEALTKRKTEYVTRTLISNLRFVSDGPDKARGWINFTIYTAHQDEIKVAIPQLVGDWICTFEKCADGRWRFKTKKTEISFGGLRAV